MHRHTLRGLTALIAALGIGVGCSSSPSGPGNSPPPPPPPPGAAQLVASAGQNQTAVAGAAVETQPAIEVKDQSGSPFPGATVVFQVTAGGGSVEGGTAVSGEDGIARVAGWTLGTVAGVNTLTATVSGLTPVAFSATGIAGPPASMEAQAGDGQTAEVGKEVPVPPAVRLTDEHGNPVEGRTVSFGVIGGGGSASGAMADTDEDGIATVGAWTLGPIAGGQTLLAAASGVTFTFNATATAAAPSDMVAQSGDGQTTSPNAEVTVAPAVRITDLFGNPVSGVDVSFAVGVGGGSLTGPDQTTNAEGVAAVGSWTVGPSAGPNTLIATAVPSGVTGSPVTFNATAASAGSFYDIEVRFAQGTSPTASQQAAFAMAEARWESVITGDLPPVAMNTNAGNCGPGSPAVNETVDDLLILARVEPIDGPGGTLGSAGPCFIRSGSSLTVIGQMRFDSDDLANLEANGLLDEVIIHEMGHVIGIGTIWSLLGLLVDPSLSGGTDPHFPGSAAIAAFNATGGSTYAGAKVPVENIGGPGTADGHWRESVLSTELMTGFIDTGGTNRLSAITVESLLDMGYTVDSNSADPFSFGSGGLRAGAAVPAIPLGDDVIRGQVYVVDRNGRVVNILRLE